MTETQEHPAFDELLEFVDEALFDSNDFIELLSFATAEMLRNPANTVDHADCNSAKYHHDIAGELIDRICDDESVTIINEMESLQNYIYDKARQDVLRTILDKIVNEMV